MLLLKPEKFSDYELIDCGNYKKLERFGNFVLSRPEPQAVWDTSMSEEDWKSRINADFRKELNNSEKGEWVLMKGMKEQWHIKYAPSSMDLRFRLGLTSFKHVGIFPEQAANWDYIYAKVKSLGNTPKVLNLFAYTGGASLAAKAAGADVTHVDSVKQVITWGRENMEASGLQDIRWVIEDAMKFVQREVRRGNKYQGIILDPPAYGRGPNGEKWIIEDQLNEIIKGCAELLDKKNHFFILNLYAIGFSALIVDTLLKSTFDNPQNMETGELYIEDKFSKKLPLSIFGRFSTV